MPGITGHTKGAKQIKACYPEVSEAPERTKEREIKVFSSVER